MAGTHAPQGGAEQMAGAGMGERRGILVHQLHVGRNRQPANFPLILDINQTFVIGNVGVGRIFVEIEIASAAWIADADAPRKIPG